ncbi:MAG: zinc ribbon domain-containing protein [Acidobacteriota bacterium]
MPIYEYKCKECGENFDLLVLSGNQTQPVCPKCGAKDPVKQFSTFSTSGPSRDPSGVPT